MSTYTDGLSTRIWKMLRDGDQCFLSDRAIGKAQAELIADTIKCHCAYRHNEARFEFSVEPLAYDHPLDYLLTGKVWSAQS